jgi:hypothetical protein
MNWDYFNDFGNVSLSRFFIVQVEITAMCPKFHLVLVSLSHFFIVQVEITTMCLTFHLVLGRFHTCFIYSVFQLRQTY